MPGIALVAGQVHRAIHRDREVEVHLDQAPVPALVPVVGVPGGARHVLEVEPLALRQREVRRGACPAFGDRGPEHGVHPLGGNPGPAAEAGVPGRERAGPREERIEPGEERVEVRLREPRHLDAVEEPRLVVEGEALAPEHPRAADHRAELGAEVAVPHPVERVGVGRNAVAQHGGEGFRRGADGRHFQRGRVGPRLQRVGPVVGVHEVRVMPPEAEHQLHVPHGHRVERRGVGRGGAVGAGGDNEGECGQGPGRQPDHGTLRVDCCRMKPTPAAVRRVGIPERSLRCAYLP